jgi:hypothetical protein
MRSIGVESNRTIQRIAFTFILRSMRALGLFEREKNGELALQTPGYGVRVINANQRGIIVGVANAQLWD